MGKGDKRRSFSTSREERALRDALAYGKITREEFDKEYAKLKAADKIIRSGRVVK